MCTVGPGGWGAEAGVRTLHHRKHLFLGDKVQHRERRHLVPQILERRPNVVNHIVDDDETRSIDSEPHRDNHVKII